MGKIAPYPWAGGLDLQRTATTKGKKRVLGALVVPPGQVSASRRSATVSLSLSRARGTPEQSHGQAGGARIAGREGRDLYGRQSNRPRGRPDLPELPLSDSSRSGDGTAGDWRFAQVLISSPSG